MCRQPGLHWLGTGDAPPPPHRCFALALHVVLIDTPDSAIVHRAVACFVCLYRAVLRADKIQGCTYVTLWYVSPSSVRLPNYWPKRVAENIKIKYVSRIQYILLTIDTYNSGNVFVHTESWAVFDP